MQILIMNKDLEIFNCFVDDLLSSDANLLKYELDILLMQYLFNSKDLGEFHEPDLQEYIFVAWFVLIMKYFYEKFWVPIMGAILSKFVFLIEGESQKKKSRKKTNTDLYTK